MIDHKKKNQWSYLISYDAYNYDDNVEDDSGGGSINNNDRIK